VKALSLRQPWANAVLYLGKNIENRRWNTSFRGEFLIHAAKGMTKKEWADANSFCAEVMGVRHEQNVLPLHPSVCLRGGIVGRARLVGVVPPQVPPYEKLLRRIRRGEKTYSDGYNHNWHMKEQYGFLLESVRETPFVSCVGHLGFFEVPSDVLARLERAA